MDHQATSCPPVVQIGAASVLAGGLQQPFARADAVPLFVSTVLPFLALVGGALILLMPRLQNYVVAIYLILVGAIGINSLFHFVR